MRLPDRALPLILLIPALGLAACGGTSSEPEQPSPAKVETVRGQKRIVVTQQGFERVGIKTAPSVRVPSGSRTLAAIPYSALLYEGNGSPYTYVQQAPRVYVRRRVTVDRIDGNRALLSSGVTPGAAVVRVGADELRGVDIGVEGE